MQWTTSQREAIETRGRRVIVSAGAGSGKTRVLVERFLRLLEENTDWRVSDVVAVTFTEKAAREMVSRIRREVRSRIERSRSAAERERWRRHRNGLDSARVGTIHSLCASILRSHPAEACLDPAFEVIEEFEATVLLEQAIQGAINDAARAGSQQYSIPSSLRRPVTQGGPADVVEIFAYMSPHDVQQAIRSLVAQGERARRAMSKLPNNTAGEILTFWRETLDRLRSEAARALIERDSWQSDSQTISRLAAIDSSDKREQCRAQVASLLASLSSEEGRAEAGGPARALLDIAACINLQGGSKKKWASEQDFIAVKESLSRMREAVRGEKLLALELNEMDGIAAQVTARLAWLYERARERFAALKRERAALDFNDLEEITERMLSSHKEVRARYTDPERGLLRALMVDEFQDTSPIQKRILWMIAPRSDELFIIGDSKQSIYRFRGADVAVFQDARAEVRAGGGREVGIDTCFRTHERLVGFVNHIFPSLFTRETRYDIPYEAMTAGHPPAHDEAAVEIHVVSQGKEAATRLAAYDLRRAEAALIARRIQEIVGLGRAMVCEKEGPARPARHEDFAILFQASTHFEIYEQALADAGIPYVTVAGRGFYDRQEITDVMNLLAFLVSPNDSLRLAAALRSPMFGLSDETLFGLRHERRTLWKSLCDEGLEHAGDQAEAVAFARETLKRLRAIAGRESAARIITAGVEETGYLATLMALPHGERRRANVEKYIEQAHALPSITLSELVGRTADLRFMEVREGEATVEEAGAVRLMTVHKSKGLEFPIVWLADASSRGGRDKDRVAAHPDYGVSVNVESDIIEGAGESLRAASFEMLRRVEESMDRAEKKRLLYVAATRAKDHLIISGAAGCGRGPGDNWLGRVLTALGVDETESCDSVDYPNGSVTLGWHDAEELIGPQPGRIQSEHNSDAAGALTENRPRSVRQQASGREADVTNPDMFPLIMPLNS
ncbi:MAG: UvrD-helicase domain-containing protein [Blastocatellia bacterium]